eukprot:CAMPEP_0169149062 /NCGR_PEP_ID=MMETSP1015-20121227/49279_1 /TAXON_ID=342587 /ORGANISM="Karlodinium micrum, Strain CCMP2283" /LENGTH=50 /DNA_ID=CAMNT_0009217763 /DNA_START=144 /DNA_END=292 /DNA_ORIENTATION=-
MTRNTHRKQQLWTTTKRLLLGVPLLPVQRQPKAGKYLMERLSKQGKSDHP